MLSIKISVKLDSYNHTHDVPTYHLPSGSNGSLDVLPSASKN